MAHGRLHRRFIDLLALDKPGKVAADRRETVVDPLFGNIVQDDIEAGNCADLRDSSAHLTRADDSDFFDFSHEVPSKREAGDEACRIGLDRLQGSKPRSSRGLNLVYRVASKIR